MGKYGFRCAGWLFLLVMLPAAGQAQHLHIRSYTIDDGLAQSQPQTILQDHLGFLWLGTRGGGLSRFDGRAFTNFTKTDGLPSNYITAIEEGTEGQLWVGTEEGVGRYRNGQWLPPPAALRRRGIRALAVTRDGLLWAGTAGGEILRYRPGVGAATDTAAADTVATLLPPSAGTAGVPAAIHTLYPDRTGRLWAGTDRGLCRVYAASYACLASGRQGQGAEVRAIVEDGAGMLWLGTDAGLLRFDGKDFEAVADAAVRDARVTALVVDRAGTLWVGTRQGLVYYDGAVFHTLTTRNGLGHDNVLALFEDREGNLWVGVDGGGGLNQVMPSPFVRFSTEHGLAENTVWAIEEDAGGQLWFGTNGSGVSRYDGARFTQRTTADGLPGNVVYAIERDRHGRLWFGTDRGVGWYAEGRFRRYDAIPVETAVWAMLEDAAGALWVGTAEDGLYRVQGAAVQHFTTADGLPHQTIMMIHETDRGELWVGTRNGLARFDGAGFLAYTAADGLSDREVTFVLDDAEGDLWVGTAGGGLNLFRRREEAVARVFTIEDGLSDDALLAATFDAEGALWLCTNNGLDRVDVPAFQQKGHVRIRRYGVAEGFTGIECNSNAVLRDGREQLWFGTVKGVMRYRPAEDRPNTLPPPTYITGVRFFFEEADWQALAAGALVNEAGLPVGLHLPYSENHLTFDFAGLSFRAPEKVVFQYKLEGLDRGWSPPKPETQATYANLPPGDYTFMVRAANSDGVWTPEPSTYAFSIRPPFWQRWWFYLLGGSGFLLAIFGFIYTREAKLKRSRYDLERLVQARTHELRAEKEKVVQINEVLARTNLELEQLSLVARETDNAVIVMDADGRIEWVNEGFTRMTGYTLEAYRREKGTDIYAVSSHPDIARVMREARTTTRSVIYESTCTTRAGTLLWLSSTLTPIFDEAGRIRRWAAIETDITERKQLERALIQAREEALEAARIKSEFLANMSHEIRTPMNAVIGMTSLLLDTPLTKEQHEFVQVIRTSGETLLGILNDILDFSKIEAGKVELEAQPFQLHSVIEEALDLIATHASDKGLELAYLIHESVPATVVGDITRVRQVLVNLLTNAVKFTEAGEVTVTVDARSSEAGEPGLYDVCFAVRDTGIGIPAEDQARLFESFIQVDASTTRKYGGTGLGLAICTRLTELMGGRMWLESEEGRGSTFHFTIRVPAAPSTGRLRQGGAAISLQERRLLIVDDNETNRRMLALQAKGWGMHAVAVAGGAEALVLLRQDAEFDVAILDMQMPEMDGLTLAAEIARLRPEEELPLVMLSSIGYRVNRGPVPVRTWLTKPVKQEQLQRTLAQVLSRQPAPREPETPRAAFDREMGRRHPLRILLAEDNVINQKVALRLLERLGYRADLAANGHEVLDLLGQRSYDLILMDIQMPEMDGLETTRQLRALLAPAQRPCIIAMTANALEQDRDRCLQEGMDDYLSKPIRVERLVAALEQVQPRRGRPLQAVLQHPEAGAGRPARPAGPRKMEVLDLSVLREMIGEDDGFVRELLQSFLADTSALLTTIAAAHAEADWPRLRRAVHTLKSTSETFGAAAMAGLCRRLEACVTSGLEEEVEGGIERLQGAYAPVEAAVHAYLAQPQA